MDSTSRHVNKSKAIELLKQLINEIPHLRTLNYANPELMPWLDRVKNILGLAFDDNDYQKFVNAKLRSDIRLMGDEVHQSNYQYNLTTRKTILQSIIDKHEILETESERLPTKEPQDTVNLAFHTFDAKESLKIYENLGGRIVGNEFEVALLGTVDMTIECMMHLTKKLNSKGHSYKSSPRIGGYPDYAKPDRTCFATCTITETTGGTEKQIGTIKLQLLPNERTLLKTSLPEEWNSSFKYFLEALFMGFERLGYLKEKKPVAIGESPKAFIAHGGDSPALRKLKDFLLSLDVQPLVVEEQVSEGRSVGENVDWYAKQADCAIILATKGDIDGRTGGFIPRGNVLIEIGKLQELFKDKIIYLLQSGTKFPTNISEKVWTQFSPQSMDKAFISVARELKAFGVRK